MALFIVMLLGIVGVVAYRITTPEERKHYFAVAIDALGDVKEVIARPRPDNDAFRSELRARMSLVLVTPAIGLITTAVFGRMLFGATAITSPDTLFAWGANLGMRTTNGEWWRLVTATFVHTGTFHFLVDLVVLIQLGLILERLVGRLAVASVYLSAGVFDGLMKVSTHPVAVTVSPTGAVFGLYGLLIAALIWQLFHTWRNRPEPNAQELVESVDAQELVPPRLTIPRIAMKRLAIGAALFLLCSAFSGRASAAEFTGLSVGLMYGAIFARRAGQKTPRPRGVAYAVFATAAIVGVSAIVIGNIADVQPELARVLALEDSTSATYQAGFNELKKGRVSAEAVAQLAEGTIVSELQEADTRLKALTNVPPEHQRAVADAREYVRLRCASWRARGMAIRRGHAERPRKPEGADDTAWRLQLQARFRADEAARANAEGAERASLEALQRVAKFLTTPRA